MNIETCQFIRMSNLFKDAPQALDAFHRLDHDCTWGTNDKTLIDAQYIAGALETILQEWEGKPTNLDKQCNLVIGRCDKLTQDILVDLES